MLMETSLKIIENLNIGVKGATAKVISLNIGVGLLLLLLSFIALDGHNYHAKKMGEMKS